MARLVISLFPMYLVVGHLSLLITFIFSASAIAGIEKRESEFRNCTKNSLFYSTPQQRDLNRLDCIEKKWPKSSSLQQCLKEARKFEYLTNEQLALKSCYHTNAQFAGIKNCLTVANQLHEVSERDDMRYDCVSVSGLPKKKSECLNVANSFEQLKYKKKFNIVCLEN